MDPNSGSISPFFAIICGLLCVFAFGGGIVLFVVIRVISNNPVARLGRAVEYRIANPRQIVHRTIVRAPEPESVQIMKWQTIQWGVGILSVIIVVVGAVVLNVADIPVAIVVAAGNLILAYFASQARRLGGGGDHTITRE